LNAFVSANFPALKDFFASWEKSPDCPLPVAHSQLTEPGELHAV
jgi:hypothetical protein